MHMMIGYTILIFFAILMHASFAASETALTSVNRIKIKSLADHGNIKAMRLNKFLQKKGSYLGTTLVGTNIALVTTSILATRIFSFHFDHSIVPLLVTVVMTPITLLFAEIVPKMIAYRFSESLAMYAIYPLGGLFRIFYPVIVAVNWISSLILTPFGGHKASWDAAFTKGDIKKLLLLGHEKGEVEADEVELIHKVLDFGSRKIESIMIPLSEVFSIEEKDILEKLKKLVSSTGFSRIPVYSAEKKNIIGIANIYDILFGDSDSGDTVKDFVRSPVHLKRTDPLDIALTRLRNRKQPMGVVVDEDSAACGIVTIEDILEELVGNIEDTRQEERKWT